MFSRSKSREAEGSVPATITSGILKTSKSCHDDQPIFKVFKQDDSDDYDRYPIKSQKAVEAFTERKRKEFKNNLKLQSLRRFSKNDVLNHNKGFESDSDQSSLTREEKQYQANQPDSNNTKRRRFLDR